MDRPVNTHHFSPYYTVRDVTWPNFRFLQIFSIQLKYFFSFRNRGHYVCFLCKTHTTN
uniref:Uncharacterized protein n=1 Tax=Octopus bimaculoides TaxID=37653 RepID=A0A0L8GTW1_OCTBM